jgi:hypothetical protein
LARATKQVNSTDLPEDLILCMSFTAWTSWQQLLGESGVEVVKCQGWIWGISFSVLGILHLSGLHNNSFNTEKNSKIRNTTFNGHHTNKSSRDKKVWPAPIPKLTVLKSCHPSVLLRSPYCRCPDSTSSDKWCPGMCIL